MIFSRSSTINLVSISLQQNLQIGYILPIKVLILNYCFKIFRGRFLTLMLSVIIPSIRSYTTLLMIKQLFNKLYILFGPLVLEINPRNFKSDQVDRDRTVSQRSKPSSCTALISEQLNPWNRFQLQDAISRHRGAK